MATENFTTKPSALVGVKPAIFVIQVTTIRTSSASQISSDVLETHRKHNWAGHQVMMIKVPDLKQLAKTQYACNMDNGSALF
ncbi:hypothetical protein CCHR01_01019 [Colletotrichum chrysophilum]|uniref:Uncharacterized protein n=1 Tax=Colletotrichum chrysophilum TaxID=1836956 RepID=A0AAD9AXA1_9PEZI|nr:hypothetical protein CCHR01_01019 [Colletotrichum chrysophilum]